MSEISKKSHSRQKGSSVWGILLLSAFFLSLLLPRCAQIVAPTGGPKDTLPPVLLNATPPDSTLNFTQRTITFNFDEFIQLKDLQKQMIVSPNPKSSPEVKSKLRTLTIRWPDNDTLKPNTTYIVNLGNAIEDINEGNVLKGFRYVFSTGDYLDSLEIFGKVVDARTGLPDSTALVMLYTKFKDSVVSKEKPLYYTRCLGDGSFRFRNLPHDTFKIFALKDENGDLEYSDSTEAIAFLKNPLVLDSTRSGLIMALFKEKETVKGANAEESTENSSSGSENKKKRKLTYQTSLSSDKQDLKKPLTLTFNAPLKSFDSSAIILQEDSTHRAVSYHFIKDTAKNKISLDYNWKEDMPYRLLLDSAFATDTSGLAYAKKDTLNFSSKSKSDYGTLILHFKLESPPIKTDSLQITDTTGLQPDTTILKEQASPKDTAAWQLVIELYKNKELIYSSPLKGDTWEKAYLDPGDYKVQVVKDVNFNGKWDRGCYYCEKQRQPEEVFSLPQKFTIRANWKNDFPDLEVKFEKSSAE